MKTHGKFILSILISFSAIQADAQYIFRHLDIVDGLTDNQIRSLSMMPDKRLAIKTASVLNIYNGATFHPFYQDKWKEYTWNYFKTPKEYYDSEGRIWMKERDHLLLLDLNTNLFIYDIDGILQSFGIHKKLINLFIDDDKNYWFITEDKSISFYDIQKGELFMITEAGSEFTQKHGIPREMAQYKNFHWIIYSDGLIRCWDHTSKEFVSQDDTFFSSIDDVADKMYINITDKDRIYMHTTPVGDLWLMLPSGIYHLDRINNRWTEVATISGLSNFFTCMDMDHDGNVWAGTSRSGLRFIHGETFVVEEVQGMRLDNGGTIYNDIFSVCVDDYNGLWVGTLFQGLCYYHPYMKKFGLHHVVDSESIITNEVIYCFLENKDGTILIGAGGGLFQFNPQTGTSRRIYEKEIKDLCISLYRDSKDRIWVSTFFNGFYCIDGHHIRNYKDASLDVNSFPNPNNARAIFEDRKGNFWVSVMGGVGKFDTKTGKIAFLYEKHPKIDFHKINYDILSIDEDTFAVVGENGIYYYNTATDEVWVPELDDPHNPKLHERRLKYYCLFKDSRSLELYGTENGLRLWDDAHKKLYVIDSQSGLRNNFISAILEDDKGVLWVSSVSGISRIEARQEGDNYHFSIVNFDALDGLQTGKFNHRSFLRASDGTFYFGGVHGFNSFNPQHITFNPSKNKPVFTSFSLFNTPIKENTEYKGRILLEQPVNQIKNIRLKHNENFITLEFAGLNYVNPSRTYFKYKLKNFDSDWNEIVTNGLGKVTYTRLPPGIYQLIVHTGNNDKIWGDEAIEITISIDPPFWATIWAFLLYFFLLVMIVIYVILVLNSRNQRKIAEQQVRNEIKQKEELDQMKFRFFTNISHEFRTPLTLIMMPLETLIKHETNHVLKEKLASIYHNAKDLMTLVNQLLDFRKLEMKGEELKLSQVNVKHFIQNIYNQFKDAVTARGIDFILEFEIDTLSMFLDESKIHKVINNLLSNSLKYTPEGGSISIVVSSMMGGQHEQLLKVSVADTGKGVAPKDMENIFNRFYQGNNQQDGLIGSGIGLHLSKEYIHLHHGEISVENCKNGGAVFTLLIPTDLQGQDAPEVYVPEEMGSDITDNLSSGNSDNRTILLVEDNTAFRKFLSEQLGALFHIIEAADGEEAERLAILKSPDLIVTDLMMPKVDGIELCKRLKTNIQTSHIPIVLLTARISDEAKIEGYEAGADSYISKPFNFDVLLIRIRKLIEQQEGRKELFHQTIEITPSSITITSLDEEFVQKALQCVENNMDNTDYSVENLSKDVGLSRVHLYRKLQSITGQTPIDFIRSIRLKRAAQYLQGSQYNISEIADMVGFNTLKYFNKHFKEEFGMTPTQYKSMKQSR